jgi:hypothetical protein
MVRLECTANIWKLVGGQARRDRTDLYADLNDTGSYQATIGMYQAHMIPFNGLLSTKIFIHPSVDSV